MKRREFLTCLGAAVTWPLAARAQQPAGRVYRVGYFAITSRERALHLTKAFEDGLRSLGYRVGENVVVEYRFADGDMGRLSALAADLVGSGVDVIVAGNIVDLTRYPIADANIYLNEIAQTSRLQAFHKAIQFFALSSIL